MQIRKAEEKDIPQLKALAKTFIEESKYPYTYSEAVVEINIRTYLSTPLVDFIVAELDGKILGGFILVHAFDWAPEKTTYMSKFFISPECRGTEAARALAKEAVRLRQGIMFITSTAGIDDRKDRMFENLFKREGFAECGKALVLV